MFENLALRGFCCIIGSFMISLAVGVMYLWGIITIYATSYFRIVMKDNTLTEDRTDIVFPLMLLGQAISMPFVTRYAKKVSSGTTCFVAGILMFWCMYFSSLTTDFNTFAIIFGLGNGLLIGVIYILPVGHCYQFFPRRKTVVSIVIIAASGVGTLIFALIASETMNPNNLTLQEAGFNLFYGKEVAERFPEYLKILSGLTVALVSGGGLLLFQFPSNLEHTMKQELLTVENKEENLAGLMDLEFVLEMEESKQGQKNPFGNTNYELADLSKGFDQKGNAVGKVYGEKGVDTVFWPTLEQSENEYEPPKTAEETVNPIVNETYAEKEVESINECPRTSDGPREAIFWVIFLVIVLGANFGLMVSVNYKTFAKASIGNDKYLTLIGGVGAIACGLSRFLWGSMLQKSTFKLLYYTMSIINLLLAFSIYFIDTYKEIYFAYVVLAYICYGGHLGMFPAVTSQIFGTRYGPQIYGILFYAFPVSNFIQYLLVNYISQGYFIIFKISGVLSICALLIVKKIELKYDWSARIREHNERKRIMAR